MPEQIKKREKRILKRRIKNSMRNPIIKDKLIFVILALIAGIITAFFIMRKLQ